MAWARAVDVHDSIAGEKVAPFLTEELEGFSIDYPDDWRYAEEMRSRRPRHPARDPGPEPMTLRRPGAGPPPIESE